MTTYDLNNYMQVLNDTARHIETELERPDLSPQDVLRTCGHVLLLLGRLAEHVVRAERDHAARLNGQY